MAKNVYVKGQKIRISVLFQDTSNANAAVDPQDVFFEYRKPDGTVSLLHYGVDIGLVKDSTGNYHSDVSLDQGGDWHYKYYSTGSGQGANETGFWVDTGSF